MYDDVPRETLDRLREFAGILVRWNRRINLVSRTEEAVLWERHILDSTQLFARARCGDRSWVDMGSGAGFPGVVCAIIAAGARRPIRFTLIESDARKSAFLREAVRQLGLDIDILTSRIERAHLPPQDVVSARALAPLDRLLHLSHPFCHAGTHLLFPKGRSADSELTLARRDWHIRVTRIPSCTDPGSTIFQISEVRRRP